MSREFTDRGSAFAGQLWPSEPGPAFAKATARRLRAVWNGIEDENEDRPSLDSYGPAGEEEDGLERERGRGRERGRM